MRNSMQQILRDEQRLIICSYLMGALIIIGQVTQNENISSYIFYLSFISTLILWLFTLLEGLNEQDLLAILILVISFSNVIINGIIEGADFTFNYVKKLVMFDTTIIYFTAACKLKIEQNTFRVLKYIYTGIGMALIAAYRYYGRKVNVFHGQYTKYLTFGFTNPNLTAVFLCCLAMFLVILAIREKRPALKLLFLLLGVFQVIFLHMTQARNAILTIWIFGMCIILSLLLEKRRQKPIPKWFIFIIAIAPLLFAAFYLRLIHNAAVENAFSFMIDEGKNLDSRERIWRRGIKAFTDSPFLGAYYQISNGTGSSQMHNSHIDILCSYGIIVFALVCVFLFLLLLHIQQNYTNIYGRAMLIGFGCALFLGTGEATIFSGGLGGYIFAGVFLYSLDNVKDENKTIGNSVRRRLL